MRALRSSGISILRGEAVVGNIWSIEARRTVPRLRPVTPPITAERRAVITIKWNCRASMKLAHSPIFKPGDALADLASDILGGGKSARLKKACL